MSSVENMAYMLYCITMRCTFNYNIGQWDVGGVTTMNYMFVYASLEEQDLNQWGVSRVTTMQGMFVYAGWNGDIGQWDVSSVTDMK